MKPVMQDTLGSRGNCMSACLASILEVPLGTVPNFYEVAGEGVSEWWAALRSWLKQFGFGVITLTFEDPAMWDQLCLDGFHIVSGPSPRLEGSFHATVWHAGRMVHDPHPDQSGIVRPETLDMLYPLDAGALRGNAGVQGRHLTESERMIEAAAAGVAPTPAAKPQACRTEAECTNPEWCASRTCYRTFGVAAAPEALRFVDMPKALQDALLAYHARPCDQEAAAIVRAVLAAYGVLTSSEGKPE